VSAATMNNAIKSLLGLLTWFHAANANEE